MTKKTLFFAIIIILFSIANFASIDEIVIFNQNFQWITPDGIKHASEYILKNVKSARNVKVLNKLEIEEFVMRTHQDNTTDAIILFGYLPETLYEPDNIQKDNSLIEKFIRGGNIIINTGDYIFYVTLGGGKNGASGLKNITNSDFDCWTHPYNCIYEPTSAGKKYIPSLPPQFTGKRPIKRDQVETDNNWEIEIVFGVATDPRSPVDQHLVPSS